MPPIHHCAAILLCLGLRLGLELMPFPFRIARHMEVIVLIFHNSWATLRASVHVNSVKSEHPKGVFTGVLQEEGISKLWVARSEIKAYLTVTSQKSSTSLIRDKKWVNLTGRQTRQGSTDPNETCKPPLWVVGIKPIPSFNRSLQLHRLSSVAVVCVAFTFSSTRRRLDCLYPNDVPTINILNKWKKSWIWVV